MLDFECTLELKNVASSDIIRCLMDFPLLRGKLTSGSSSWSDIGKLERSSKTLGHVN